MANKQFFLDRETDPLNPALEVANKDELIKVYDNTADMESDIANIEDDEIVSCKGNDYEGIYITNTVSNGNLNPVTSNAVYQALQSLGSGSGSGTSEVSQSDLTDLENRVNEKINPFFIDKNYYNNRCAGSIYTGETYIEEDAWGINFYKVCAYYFNVSTRSDANGNNLTWNTFSNGLKYADTGLRIQEVIDPNNVVIMPNIQSTDHIDEIIITSSSLNGDSVGYYEGTSSGPLMGPNGEFATILVTEDGKIYIKCNNAFITNGLSGTIQGYIKWCKYDHTEE